MRYLLYTLYIIAACAIVGCKGSHKENSPEVADLVKFDDLGEDAYFFGDEDSTTNAARDTAQLSAEADSVADAADDNDSVQGDTTTGGTASPQPAAVPAPPLGLPGVGPFPCF